MNLLRLLALCLTAAMVCATIRMAHPQIAAAVAVACGAGIMLLSLGDLGVFSETIGKLERIAGKLDGESLMLLKLCGIALVAEFASDVCRDAGETALARRLDTGIRIGIVAAAIPAGGRLLDSITELLA